MAKRTCSIEGCGDPVKARDWCAAHYQRWRRTGDPLNARVHLPWPENLTRRMDPQPDGCIYFTGTIGDGGYGAVGVRHRGTMTAHRAAYEYFVGPIPDGMTIDHECHNSHETCGGGNSCLHRRCVNVEHLAVKSIGENARSSRHTFASINAAKTHCPRGHEYTPENTGIYHNHRRCLACDRDKRRVERQ